MDKQQSLSKISKELMLKEPYYGFFLIMLNKLWDARRVPTAGVSKNGINYQLAINPEFWDRAMKNNVLKDTKWQSIYYADMTSPTTRTSIDFVVGHVQVHAIRLPSNAIIEVTIICPLIDDEISVVDRKHNTDYGK